ncbi:hypothetical protein SKAU_G00065770 [Synaphobranchus kaupii]|uniref:Uncharacterized protein n=1 Tax=Synaphobranchus kaupii TaxID=118154 RepID=A0A9Q1G5U4_SYNKA|nr:hypothetical protein SKAU_G00065770 [Synaphobranchus kaupii]
MQGCWVPGQMCPHYKGLILWHGAAPAWPSPGQLADSPSRRPQKTCSVLPGGARLAPSIALPHDPPSALVRSVDSASLLGSAGHVGRGVRVTGTPPAIFHSLVKCQTAGTFREVLSVTFRRRASRRKNSLPPKNTQADQMGDFDINSVSSRVASPG